MSPTSIVKEVLRPQAAIVLTVIGRMAETVVDAVDVPAAEVVIVDAAVVADVPVAADGIVAGAAGLAAEDTKPFATDLRGSARIDLRKKKGFDYGRGLFSMTVGIETEKQVPFDRLRASSHRAFSRFGMTSINFECHFERWGISQFPC